MAKKLFVGNLSWDATNDDLMELFSQYGEVSDAFVLRDRETKRSRGFGFVTFEDDAAADKAVEALHEKEFMGRNLIVNEARPAKTD